MSLPKDHLSVTQVRMYLRCPARYYYHYVQGIKLPPSGSMLLGRAVHSGLEHYLKVKLNSGDSIPPNEVLDAYDTVFEREKADAVHVKDKRPTLSIGRILFNDDCSSSSYLSPVVLLKAKHQSQVHWSLYTHLLE